MLKIWTTLKWVLLVAICLALFITIRQNVRLKKDVSRDGRNLKAATDSLQRLTLKDGRSAAQGEALEMRLGEIEKYMPRVIDEIHKMGVKPSQTQAVSTTGFTAIKNFTSYLHDSTVADTQHFKIFHYADAWYQVSGIAAGDSQSVAISNRDTLIQVIYRGARTKWWNPFSPRPLLQRCAFSNPSAQVSYQQTIQISK